MLGRRSLLILGGVSLVGVGLSACGGDGTAATSTPAIDVADAVRADVATSERALIALYADVVAAYPDLTTLLDPIRVQHEDHLAAIGADGAAPSGTRAGATSDLALAQLVDAERQAARERRASCIAASDPELARVLALIAASEQSHVPALRRGGVA